MTLKCEKQAIQVEIDRTHMEDLQMQEITFHERPNKYGYTRSHQNTTVIDRNGLTLGNLLYSVVGKCWHFYDYRAGHDMILTIDGTGTRENWKVIKQYIMNYLQK